MNSILLVGVGGYGALNASEALENAKAHNAYIVGVVEPYIDNSPVKDKLGDIPVYKTLEAFYAQHTADLAVISTPIHLHPEQCCYCMAHGSDVLCEKPIAPTIKQANEMKACAAKFGKHLNIGFQLCYAPDMLKLKERIKTFGKLKSISVLTSWPRNSQYFARPWAAKRTFNGEILLDSIMMNACAHYFENPLFLLGENEKSAAMPDKIRGKLYRVNDIEMFDTAIIEATVKGAPFRFLVTHAGEENINPLTKMEFELCTVSITVGEDDSAMTAVFNDGRKENLGASYKHPFEKIWYALDVFNNKKAPVCDVDTALPHLACVDAVSEKISIETVKDYSVVNDTRVINGLLDKLKAAYEDNTLPDVDMSDWIDLQEYFR